VSRGLIVLKLGGELLDHPEHLASIVAALADTCRDTRLVVVHGGGREIDAALHKAGVDTRQVDGLRITDRQTLEVVVAVLAGTVNTRLVAALVGAGVAAVGLTGADAACGLADRAPVHRAVDGRLVDLEEVGIPQPAADPRLIRTLVEAGYVPVLASIGLGADARLLNVNADTFAGSLAARLGAHRLVIAGTTAGVLGPEGTTVREADRHDVERLVRGRTATAGMVAKLSACLHALEAGVGDVLIVDGRSRAAIEQAVSGSMPAGATRLVDAGIARPETLHLAPGA
jgi:acetylglutamate kinase